jgi:hypothetical protein
MFKNLTLLSSLPYRRTIDSIVSLAGIAVNPFRIHLAIVVNVPQVLVLANAT